MPFVDGFYTINKPRTTVVLPLINSTKVHRYRRYPQRHFRQSEVSSLAANVAPGHLGFEKKTYVLDLSAYLIRPAKL